MRRLRTPRGTTFVELLVALAFLGLCAGALLDAVRVSRQRMASVARRANVLAGLQLVHSQVAAMARSGMLAVVDEKVTGSIGANAEASYRTIVTARTAEIFRVVISAEYFENYSGGSVQRSISFETEESNGDPNGT